MKRSLLLAVLVSAFLPTAKADSIWDVTGSFTLVGNSACNGPCVESARFSFDLQYIPLFPGINNGQYQAEVTNFTTSGSGDAGSFTYSNAGPLFLAGLAEGGYIGFPMAGGITEMDIEIPGTFDRPTPKAPGWYLLPTLYSCGTAACVMDFGTLPQEGETGQIGIFRGATATYSISNAHAHIAHAHIASVADPIPTREPGLLFMLAIGLVALAITVKSK